MLFQALEIRSNSFAHLHITCVLTEKRGEIEYHKERGRGGGGREGSEGGERERERERGERERGEERRERREREERGGGQQGKRDERCIDQPSALQ